MKTTPCPNLPRPPNIIRAQCPEVKATASGMYPFYGYPQYQYYIPFMSDYLWKLNNILNRTFSWMYTDLVRYKAEEGPYVYVSDYINDRIVILDLDLNWVNSIDTATGGAPQHSVADATHLYIDGGDIDKWLKYYPYTYTTLATGNFTEIAVDDDYIYIFGTVSGVRVVRKHNKSDLTYVDEFDTTFARTPCGLVVDDTHIYCAEATTAEDNLKKFLKSDYSEVATTKETTNVPFNGMAGDSTYLYYTTGSGAGDAIGIQKKSDLSLHDTLTGISTYGWDIAVDGDYAYVADYTDDVVRKVTIATGTVVATFGEVGVTGNDSSHLYQPRGVAVYGG